MKKGLFKLCILLLLSISIMEVQAQNAVSATGGIASGSRGSVSYSVGLVDYSTSTSSGGSVSQGVQQAYTISYVTGLEVAKGISLSVSAYPNPTTDFLILKVDITSTLNNQSLSYQLVEASGKVLESKKLQSNPTSIDMHNFVKAAYFLKVIEGNKEIKTVKIIKN